MEKLNIAEILKDCPSGTKLYSTLCGECEIVFIDRVHIIIKDNDNKLTSLFSNGTYRRNGECVLFPSKDQRDWSKFQIPFKDGDIIYFITKNDNEYIFIFKNNTDIYIETYVDFTIVTSRCSLNTSFYSDNIKYQRLATEEEKQKLFQAIKDNGYKWNKETKTLEKLPKFKVGDRIMEKDGISVPILITGVGDTYYWSTTENSTGVLPIAEQDDWELVPDKFDITTLKPFDKVLVRTFHEEWKADFFSHYSKESDFPYSTVGKRDYYYCIPYEKNEHLLGTTNDCDEYYKTWE